MADEYRRMPGDTSIVVTGGASSSGDKKHVNRLGSVTFQENPVEYCKALYEEFKKHNEDQHDRIERNRKFYEGIDDILEKRKAAKVVRSAHFEPEARPALESVKASIIDSLSEYELSVQFIPNEESQDEPETIRKIEAQLNREMRECGFLDHSIDEMIGGAQLMPLVACKVGWEIEEGWVYEKVPITQQLIDRILYMVRARKEPPSGMRKVWGIAKEGPCVDVLDWDEFPYDPTVGDIKSMRGLPHPQLLGWNEFVDRATENGWRKEAISKMKEEMDSYLEGEDVGKDSLKGEIAKEIESGRRAEYKDGKVMVCEFWIPTHDNLGRPETRIFTLGANKYRLSKEKYGRRSDWDKIVYPFAVLRFNKQFGRMEGTPPIEVVMPVQQNYNDYGNAFNDGFSYGLFPPILQEAGTQFEGQPKYEPGAIWKINKVDGIQTLHNGIRIPDLALLSTAKQESGAKIRQLVNAPDTSQGMETPNDQEKAIKTRLREMGSQRRSRVTYKAVGDLIISVAQMIMYMHQAMGDEEWLLDVTIDVPALTGAYSPMEEKETAIMIWNMAKENPLYQAVPNGMNKLRNIWEEVLQKMRVKDIDDKCPTETEMMVINPLGQEVEEAAEMIDEQQAMGGSQIGNAPGDVTPAGGETEELNTNG